MTVRVSPVRRFLTNSLTLGMAAPDELVTVPWIPPLVWAHSPADRIIPRRNGPVSRLFAAESMLAAEVRRPLPVPSGSGARNFTALHDKREVPPLVSHGEAHRDRSDSIEEPESRSSPGTK